MKENQAYIRMVEELTRIHPETEAERLSELLAFALSSGTIDLPGKKIWIEARSPIAIKRCYSLLKGASRQSTEEAELVGESAASPRVDSYRSDRLRKRKRWRLEVDLSGGNGFSEELAGLLFLSEDRLLSGVLHSQEGARAFFRGIFLVCGKIWWGPGRYAMDFYFSGEKAGRIFRRLLEARQLLPRERRYGKQENLLLYLRGAEKVIHFVGLAGAIETYLYLADLKIFSEWKAGVNREVNAETANIRRTVEAATELVEKIRRVARTPAFGKLSPLLRSAAKLRLENPLSNIRELGELISPPRNKNSMASLLRRLNEKLTELEAELDEELLRRLPKKN